MKAWIGRLGEGARLVSSAGAAAGESWLRFGNDVLFVGEGPEALSRQVTGEFHPRTALEAGDLRLVTQLGALFQFEHPDVPVLVNKGRYLVVDVAGRRLAKPGHNCWSIEPLPLGTTVFEDRGRGEALRRPVKWVQDLVDQVVPERFRTTLETLVSFPTRLSTSEHYAAAAHSAFEELVALGYDTRRQGIEVDGGVSQNVIADKPGEAQGPRSLVFLVAHLDSVNTLGGATTPAPGADDNGSGSAGLLEIARVLSDAAFSHDLRLVLFGGEEQGLLGSRQHVNSLPAAERKRIAAVVNMDMIAGRNTALPTVLIEGSVRSQALIESCADAAAVYTSLAVETSLRPFNSDHVSFLDAGIPAVLTIEGVDQANPRVHTADDTIGHVDGELAVEILRMNVATVAKVLGNPTDAGSIGEA